MSDSAALKLRSIVSKNDDENRFVRRPRNDVRSLGQSRLMSLTDVLASSGCHLFLEAMRKANRLQGANSITILAPNDDAFHSADAFEDSSWGLHIMDGAYKIGELVNFNGGRVQPQSLEPKHALTFRVEIGGHMVAYVSGETKPARRTRMVKTDLVARDGVFVHIVNKILYAE